MGCDHCGLRELANCLRVSLVLYVKLFGIVGLIHCCSFTDQTSSAFGLGKTSSSSRRRQPSPIWFVVSLFGLCGMLFGVANMGGDYGLYGVELIS